MPDAGGPECKALPYLVTIIRVLKRYNFWRSTIGCVGFENTVGFTDPAAPGSSTGYHFKSSSVISEGHPADMCLGEMFSC